MVNKIFKFSALGVLLIASMACSGAKREEKVASEAVVEAEKPQVVKTAVVSIRDVDQNATFTGTIEAQTVNQIAPQTASRIKNIYAEIGDRVSKGQKLAEMDGVNLEQSRIRLENAKAEFERSNELYKIGGESKSIVDARKLELDVAESSYKNLKENTTLVSPVSGVVTARNYDKGDMYNGTPIYVVEQIRPVKLTINISEQYYSKIKKGMEVAVVAEAYGDEKFVGTINLIYPTIDPSTRTFPVEVRIANGDERIRPGMFARASLSFGTEQRIVVPDLAVIKQSGSGDNYVYTVGNSGTVELNKVELGQRMGSEYEIISGLENGDTVITSGQVRLKKGDKVTQQ